MPPPIFRPRAAVLGSTQLRPCTTQVARDDQPIQHVTSVLNECKSAGTNYLAKLLHQGHIEVLDKETNAKYRKMYGGGDWDVPVLAGHKSFPWARSVPSTEEVQYMIKTDMCTTGSYRLWPTATIGESQVEAARLVTGITEPKFQGQGHSIRNLIAPSLDSWPASNSLAEWEGDGVLRQSTFQATVMPSKGLIDIVHHEQWTVSTLMTGTRVLLVFGPTKKNLDKLRAHYDQLAGDAQLNTWNMINDLEGGIAFVQQAGETAYIAPFCCFASFSIPTSTSAERYITIAANKYLMRLQNLPVYLAWNKLYQDNFQQTRLSEYMKILADDLNRIMGKSIPDCDTSATIIQICQAWDRVKCGVIKACAEIWNEKHREEVFESFETAWLRIMTGENRKDNLCPICAREMVADDTRTQAGKALAHFTFVHWKGVELPEPRTTRSMAAK
ncbi:hypothetical protein BDV96DRAFT_606661 [Lophiotrema nucula]|uniref:JmjC domain-containing protein n=1 Tax=Lophiotrema nucula TaxID=690887 RepID=A0A6A5YJU6_9PLEO|nr:hypothetical protein BDV96DRAFT_606661 [Lophiotrema nucula]